MKENKDKKIVDAKVFKFNPSVKPSDYNALKVKQEQFAKYSGSFSIIIK